MVTQKAREYVREYQVSGRETMNEMCAVLARIGGGVYGHDAAVICSRGAVAYFNFRDGSIQITEGFGRRAINKLDKIVAKVH